MPPLLGSTGDGAKAFGFSVSSAVVAPNFYIHVFSGGSTINTTCNHSSVDSNMVGYLTGIVTSPAIRGFTWKNSSTGTSVSWQTQVNTNAYRGELLQVTADGQYLFYKSSLYMMRLGLTNGSQLATPTTIGGTAIMVDATSASGSIVHMVGPSSTQGVLLACKIDVSTQPMTITWSRTYQDSAPSTNNALAGGVAKKGSGGAVFITGSYLSTGFITKVSDTDGSPTWLRRHSVSGQTSSSYARCCSDSSDNVYAAGVFQNTAAGANLWITKTNTSGTLQWSKSFNSTATGSDNGYAVCMSSDETSIYVLGNVGNTNATCILNINASTGALNWQRTISQTNSWRLTAGKIFASSTTLTILGSVLAGSYGIHFAMAVPADGTKTGSYTTTGSFSTTWTYAASSYTYADTGAVTVTTTGWPSNAAAGLTAGTSAGAMVSGGYTYEASVVVT